MTFALAYSSIVRDVSRGLISHYAKADVRKRLLAGSIDGLLVVTLCLVCWIVERRSISLLVQATFCYVMR